MLVIGVVAAKLCAARGRIDLHLPPRPIVKLKLLEGRTITAALADQDLLAAAVKRGQRGVPPPCCDLFSELPAGRHPEPLPALSQCSVCYRYCNASAAILQFQPAKKVIFGVQPKE